MKSKFAFVIVLLSSLFFYYTYAGGGGGGKGGGSGGGGGSNENQWQDADIFYVGINSAPSALIQGCGDGIFPSTTAYHGTNTYPVLTPSYLNGPVEHLAQVVIQDLTTSQILKQPISISTSNTPIIVPKFHSFRVTWTMYVRCLDCMSPLLIPLNPGDGRRVVWSNVQDCSAGTNFIGVAPDYLGLASCQ